jgi:hypothetical protein
LTPERFTKYDYSSTSASPSAGSRRNSVVAVVDDTPASISVVAVVDAVLE